MRSVVYSLAVVFFLSLIFFVHPVPAVGVTHGTIEVQPAFVDVDLIPKNAESEIEITYTNHTDQPITLELSPIDFHQTSPLGSIGFLGEDASTYSYSLSSFLSFETNRLDLAPGEKKVFHLVAKNRQDLSPGGHYAAVIAKEVQSTSGETVLTPAVSTLIYLRKVGGERFNLSLKDISWPGLVSLEYPPTVTALFQNEGNVHLIPTGVMEVKDMFGRVVARGTLNEGFVRVLPESTRYVPIYLKRVHFSLPISINTVTLTGSDSLHKVVYKRSDVYLYVHPLFIFAVLLCIGLWFVFRKRGGSTKPTRDETQMNVVPQEGERVKRVKVKRRRAKND